MKTSHWDHNVINSFWVDTQVQNLMSEVCEFCHEVKWNYKTMFWFSCDALRFTEGHWQIGFYRQFANQSSDSYAMRWESLRTNSLISLFLQRYNHVLSHSVVQTSCAPCWQTDLHSEVFRVKWSCYKQCSSNNENDYDVDDDVDENWVLEMILKTNKTLSFGISINNANDYDDDYNGDTHELTFSDENPTR